MCETGGTSGDAGACTLVGNTVFAAKGEGDFLLLHPKANLRRVQPPSISDASRKSAPNMTQTNKKICLWQLNHSITLFFSTYHLM